MNKVLLDENFMPILDDVLELPEFSDCFENYETLFRVGKRVERTSG